MFGTHTELPFPQFTPYKVANLFFSGLYTVFFSDALASAIVHWDWTIVVYPIVFYTKERTKTPKFSSQDDGTLQTLTLTIAELAKPTLGIVRK